LPIIALPCTHSTGITGFFQPVDPHIMTRLSLATVFRQLSRKREVRMRQRARQAHGSYVDRFGIIIFLGGVLMPLAWFLALANRVVSGGPFVIEKTWLLFLHGFEATLLDHIALVTSMLVTVVGVGVLCWLLLIRRQWHTALFWLTSIAGAAILNSIVKKAIRRDRPGLWDLISPHSSFGFPSGHAMQSMAIAVGLVVLFRYSRSRSTLIAGGIASVLLVGTCRMYLGLHYPTDVLAGWMLALAWVTALAMLFDERYLSIGAPRIKATNRIVPIVSDEDRLPTAQ
jgi:membrane-associated phospholipid phosphatase